MGSGLGATYTATLHAREVALLVRKGIDPAGFLLSVVIPVYNEVQTIEDVVRRVRAAPYRKEIVLVDDGSTDGTRELVQRLEGEDLTRCFHAENRGKGAAVRTGFAAARGDVVVIQDADLEYDPKDLPALLAPILDGRADAAYGSRFLGGPHRVHLFWHYAGNKFLTLFSNALTNLNLTDMETGYKAFRRDLLVNLPLRSKRFGIEPELTAKLARRRCRVYEVPISYSGRDYAEGKKIGWLDGLTAIFWILRFRLFD